MSFKLIKLSKVIVFCLLAFILSVSLNKKLFAFDKEVSDALSHYIMGTLHDDLGDVDSAIDEYRKALEKDSQSAIIHLNLAASYIKKNEINKAIEELILASNLDAHAVEPHAILAILYSSQNKFQEATIEYEAALKNASKIEPENINIYKNLGILYLQQKRLDEAEGIYKLIIDLSCEDAEAHFYLASIYNELKNFESAEAELKKTLELRPDYHEALNFLGYMYVEADRNLEEAQGLIDKALSMDPDNGAYIDSLGWLYYKTGRYEDALKELKRAISLLEDPVIFDHLGDAYYKINDLNNAKNSWQKSLELDSGQEKIKEKLKNVNLEKADG